MKLEIFIAAIAIIVMALIYFAQVQRRQKERKDDERYARITDIISTYISNVRSNKDSELSGLLRAGILTLDNDEEIRKVCSEIIRHNERDPLRRYRKLLKDIDLKGFFEAASKYGLANKSPEEIVKEMNS